MCDFMWVKCVSMKVWNNVEKKRLGPVNCACVRGNGSYKDKLQNQDKKTAKKFTTSAPCTKQTYRELKSGKNWRLNNWKKWIVKTVEYKICIEENNSNKRKYDFICTVFVNEMCAKFMKNNAKHRKCEHETRHKAYFCLLLCVLWFVLSPSASLWHKSCLTFASSLSCIPLLRCITHFSFTFHSVNFFRCVKPIDFDVLTLFTVCIFSTLLTVFSLVFAGQYFDDIRCFYSVRSSLLYFFHIRHVHYYFHFDQLCLLSVFCSVFLLLQLSLFLIFTACLLSWFCTRSWFLLLHPLLLFSILFHSFTRFTVVTVFTLFTFSLPCSRHFVHFHCLDCLSTFFTFPILFNLSTSPTRFAHHFCILFTFSTLFTFSNLFI